jgi:chromosome segregation ATPase
MRKLITLISAMALLVGMLALPAAADHNDEHAALEQAVVDAQAEVDRLIDLVAELEGDLKDAEEMLADAEEALDDAQDEVDRLQQELDEANDDLSHAIEHLAELEAARNLLLNPGGQCKGEGTQEGAECIRLTREIAETNDAIEGLEEDIDELEGQLQTAEQVRDDASDNVDDAQAEVERIQGLLREANVALVDAQQELEDAKAALDAYEDPAVEDEHPGCKGVKNAQEQVVKNGRGNGKAAETLADVAAKFECAA